MISKEDAKNYLNKMLETEMQMNKGYAEVAAQVNSEKYKKEFLDMSAEEVEHAKMVKSLMDLLEKWADK